MAELKKCPFCGGEAKIVEDNTIVEISQYQIRCKNVTCTIRPKTNWHIDKQEAIKHWNNRATESEIKAKAIDEFVKAIEKNQTIQDSYLSPPYFEMSVDMTDILKIAEQLKEEQ